ncbi:MULTISPECIES: hypothetical protein [Catenuloplanes]|uniref:Tox-REase-7 domain-containing protein n=1 Tax=Catenuloplanes niger TaxID=587534 RepID=A0AAE3ZJG4_9ACTN|nr:hypothetical protein [Catenuloplanes niger]MDR7319821.1 hypothetical protein [Catenuloplanes niger]
MPPPRKALAPPTASVRAPAPATAGPAARRRPGPDGIARAQATMGNAAVTAALTAGVPVPGVPPTRDGAPGTRSRAGNALVTARLTARTAPGPVRRSPATDPAFAALVRDVDAKKTAVARSHPPAPAEATAAQAAAVPPADDREARGKAAHAEEMAAAEPREFDRARFIAAVEAAIAAKAPKNLDEAESFGDSGRAEEVRAEVQGEVGAGKDASAEQIATSTARTPAPARDGKPVTPLTPDRLPARPGAPDPRQAAPDRLPPSATDLSAGPERIRRDLAAAKVTRRQLSFENSREPSFDRAVTETETLETHARSAPARLRATENREIGQVTHAAGRDGTAAMAAIHGVRAETGRTVGAGKAGARGRDERRRAAVTARLQDVFDRTKADVERILSDLDTAVDRQFTAGERRARDRFTDDHERGMRRYKRERYSGWNGAWLWAKDRFLPLPDEANRIYQDAKTTYLASMRDVIIGIAGTVESHLRRAKDRIAAGRTELRAAVRALPGDLRAIGQRAAAEFAGRFDELRDTVTDKGTELVDTLATRYTEAVSSVDAEIAAEREKNRGLVAKAADAVGGALATIRDLTNLLLGVLRKAAQAIGAILRDPVGFLGNLVSAVGGGLRLFLRNLGGHLRQGVLGWLLGTASAAGLTIPRTFDVRGIALMITGLLGLTWGGIRARLVRRAPEPAVTAAETAVPQVARAKREGAAGLWTEMRAHLGDLRADLIGRVVAYVTPTVVVAGITWILSLLNPASAFVRACKLIIDVLRFVVTQARQIIDFVNAVLDAVLAIARGGAGGVPALVERALARSIPVLIGALAAILGVGGVAARVRRIVQSLSRPVDRAVDAAVDRIARLVTRFWATVRAAPARRGRPAGDAPDRGGQRAGAAAKRSGPRDGAAADRRGQRTGGVPDRGRGPGRRAGRPHRAGRPRHVSRPGTATRPDRSGRKQPARPARDADRVLSAALREARALIRAGLTAAEIGERLPGIRRRHGLTRLDLVIGPVRGTRQIVHFVAVVNPAMESPREGTPLDSRTIEADYGILVTNQDEFQRMADRRNLVIDVRPTNPDSVRHLQRGAFYKPVDIKAKTINSADLLLTVKPEHQGKVGFFVNRPPDPKRRGLSEADRARGRDRWRMRVEERRRYGRKMRKLARKPKGPGRFEVVEYVVHGYDAAGRRRPVAGDHDLYDIRRPDGSALPLDEYEQLIVDMQNREFGVMHGAVVYWSPTDPAERAMRDKLVAQHRRGGSEGLVRFTPHAPPTFAYGRPPL